MNSYAEHVNAWLQHPSRVDFQVYLQRMAQEQVKALLNASYESTDPKVRGIAMAYRAIDMVVASMQPRETGEKE